MTNMFGIIIRFEHIVCLVENIYLKSIVQNVMVENED